MSERDSTARQSCGAARTGRITMLSAWTALNLIAFGMLEWLPSASTIVIILLIVVASPLFIEAVHAWDQRFHCLGLRCMRQALPQIRADHFRRSVRLEMLVITSGFAATLFILSVQLYLELGPGRTPPAVMETMALLFFLASVINLLQILLHDFKLSCDLSGVKEMKDRIDKKLEFFMGISWHALVSPVILAFSLLDERLSVVVNLLYGFLLFHYYFLPSFPAVVEYHDQLVNPGQRPPIESVDPEPPVPNVPPAEVPQALGIRYFVSFPKGYLPQSLVALRRFRRSRSGGA